MRVAGPEPLLIWNNRETEMGNLPPDPMRARSGSGGALFKGLLDQSPMSERKPRVIENRDKSGSCGRYWIAAPVGKAIPASSREGTGKMIWRPTGSPKFTR